MGSFTPEGDNNSLSTNSNSKSKKSSSAQKAVQSEASNPPQDATKFLPTINLDISKLPSKGLSYPKNAEIKYRPYTFGEIKKASQSKMSFKDSIKFVLDGIDCSFPKRDISLYDVMYLSFLRNISSIKGVSYKIEHTCPECGKLGATEFPLTNIEFQDIEAPKLPVNATFNNKQLQFTPLTLGDFIELLDQGMEEDDVALLAKKCRNIDFKEAYNIIENLMGDEQTDALDIEKALNHEIKPIEVVCKNKVKDFFGEDKICGTKMNIELSGGESLITPFRGDKNSNKSRISFG